MVRWVVGSILHGGPIELYLVPASAPRLVYYTVCWVMHIKESLLLIGFPLSLSEWSFTLCSTPYNRKFKTVMSASLNKTFPSFQTRTRPSLPLRLLSKLIWTIGSFLEKPSPGLLDPCTTWGRFHQLRQRSAKKRGLHLAPEHDWRRRTEPPPTPYDDDALSLSSGGRDGELQLESDNPMPSTS